MTEVTVACLGLRRAAGRGAVLLLLAVLVAAGPLFRAFEQNQIWSSKAYLASFDAIAFGCLAAVLTHRRAIPRGGLLALTLLGASASVAVLLLERHPSFTSLNRAGLTETILALGVAGLLVAASCARDPHLAARWLRPLTAWGRLSYEIYLTHAFVVLGAVSVFEGSNLSIDAAPLMLAVVLAVSWALGALVERYVSSPSNRRLRLAARRPFSARSGARSPL